MRTLRVSIDRVNNRLVFWRITGAKEYPYRPIVESILSASQGWESRSLAGESWIEFQRVETSLDSR